MTQEQAELHIETSYKDLERTDAIEQHAHDAANKQLGRFAGRLTRVEIHISDENAHKSGPDDKKVLIEARPKGFDPLVVDDTGSDLYKTIDSAAAKMHRVLETTFAKHDHR